MDTTSTATTTTPPTPRRARRRRAGLLRRLLRDTTGVVYAEAVVMMPFFIIIFGCIMWVHTYYSHRIQLSSRVKACAWVYANNGCTTVPPECTGLTTHTGNGIDPDALPPGQSSDLVAFAQLPIVHGIVDIILGKNAEINRQETVNRPPVLGGGGSNIFSNQSVMCNENPRDPGTVAHDAFCSLTHIC